MPAGGLVVAILTQQIIEHGILHRKNQLAPVLAGLDKLTEVIS